MAKTTEITRFGEKLHKLRKANGYTMQALAAKLKYASHGWISEIETGKRQPSIEFTVRISRLFDVTTDALLKDELDVTLPD